jgi:hypothetical protein
MEHLNIAKRMAREKLFTSSIPVLRSHFKSHAIPKHPPLLGILVLNMLITFTNFSLSLCMLQYIGMNINISHANNQCMDKGLNK